MCTIIYILGQSRCASERLNQSFGLRPNSLPGADNAKCVPILVIALPGP
jgi:hypothetical protein